MIGSSGCCESEFQTTELASHNSRERANGSYNSICGACEILGSCMGPKRLPFAPCSVDLQQCLHSWGPWALVCRAQNSVRSVFRQFRCSKMCPVFRRPVSNCRTGTWALAGCICPRHVHRHHHRHLAIRRHQCGSRRLRGVRSSQALGGASTKIPRCLRRGHRCGGGSCWLGWQEPQCEGRERLGQMPARRKWAPLAHRCCLQMQACGPHVRWPQWHATPPQSWMNLAPGPSWSSWTEIRRSLAAV